ncbi:DUF302 domain-containing protein [Thiomicrospira sp. ALE5]|uniref:DUF302 domain-containing protein n=1 Tax=Thiomicrospira sp. ALE5 TaxID=748650 RepID=UPI0008E686A1|nr:DUF302 domain-containing protein [Thiomicrospira sp. ALE5]SFR62587.1 Uncharacterized conserved protein, DUF302 family [Thiomicrospira sp. ALE5]
MYYVLNTGKTFEQACEALNAAVVAIPFGVLHVHDLGATLRSKGFDFAEECRVFEVCSPAAASKVLAADMHLNMALPCRISVFTEQGQVKIGMIEPIQVLNMLSDDPAIKAVATDVQTKLSQAIEQAAQ